MFLPRCPQKGAAAYLEVTEVGGSEYKGAGESSSKRLLRYSREFRQRSGMGFAHVFGATWIIDLEKNNNNKKKKCDVV